LWESNIEHKMYDHQLEGVHVVPTMLIV